MISRKFRFKIREWYWKIRYFWNVRRLLGGYFHSGRFEFIFCHILDPILDRVESFSSYFGTLFVAVILILLAGYVFVAYYIGLPYWNERSPAVLKVAFTIGHWLLLNVCWNYYKALYTDPGGVADREISGREKTFCRKCHAHRPARAHHCSVCRRCILKMDHHCPWLNNCIGLRNQRYFILFCVYVWAGTIFVMIFGALIALDYYFPPFSLFEESLFYFPDDLSRPLDGPVSVLGLYSISSAWLRQKCIIYETVMTILLFFIVFFLLRYHFSMISNGQTCIESHINQTKREESIKNGTEYRNPYDYGFRENWRRLLNVDSSPSSWTNVLLPSEFIPDSNGFDWNQNRNIIV